MIGNHRILLRYNSLFGKFADFSKRIGRFFEFCHSTVNEAVTAESKLMVNLQNQMEICNICNILPLIHSHFLRILKKNPIHHINKVPISLQIEIYLEISCMFCSFQSHYMICRCLLFVTNRSYEFFFCILISHCLCIIIFSFD